MKRLITRAAAVICTLSLLTVSAPLSAGAAEWINLSSWAYAEVSGFVSDGLLPEVLEGETDYTRPVTRGEFAELIYSVLESTGVFKKEYGIQCFSDCSEYPDINRLGLCRIASGYEDDTFRPELAVTREDAAVFVSRAMVVSGMIVSYDADAAAATAEAEFTDADEISAYAVPCTTAVIEYGIMNGAEDRAFRPKAELTVEQAVIMAYRFYKRLPRLINSDNDNMSGTQEETVQSFENGLVQTYDGESYYIKDEDMILMSFESDVYSKLLSGSGDGKRLAFAVNFNDNTDVYDLESGELLYTIPYIVYKLDDGYAYVYSSRYMPAYSGMYSMDGKELVSPEYSENELEIIAANGFEVPEPQYRAPDGWIYYSNQDDNGSLWKTDSNGENRQCLVRGLDCYDTEYYKGILYFKAHEDPALYRIGSDGEDFVKLSEEAELVWPTIDMMRGEFYNKLNIYTDVNGNKSSMDLVYQKNEVKEESFGGSIFYGEPVIYIREYMVYSEMLTQQDDAYMLYEIAADGSENEGRLIADFPVYNLIGGGSAGNMYFLNANDLMESGESEIYVYDGNTLGTVADGVKVTNINFLQNSETNEPDTGKLCYTVMEELEEGTYHILDLNTGETTAETFQKRESAPKRTSYYEDLSTGDMTVWKDTGAEKLYVEYNGTTKDLGDTVPIHRDGEWIFYLNQINATYVWFSAIPIRPLLQEDDVVRAYNYVTGEDIAVASDLDEPWVETGSVYIYSAPTMMYKRLSAEGCVSVYPSKGISPYGEVETITKCAENLWQPNYLYKVDKDGNVTALTDCGTEAWCYVPDGADQPSIRQWN